MPLGLVALSLPFSVLLIISTRVILGLPQFEILPWYAMTIYPAIVLLPVALSTGIILAQVARAGITRSAIIGFLFYLIIDFIFLWKIEILISAIFTAGAILLLLSYFSETPFIKNFFIAIFVLLTGFTLLGGAKPLIVFHQAFSRNSIKHIESKQSAYGYQGIYQTDSGKLIALNHTPVILESDKKQSEEIIHFSLLQHIMARKVLLIGDGSEALEEVLKYPAIQSVTWAPTLPIALDSTPKIQLSDSRIRTIKAKDPRLFIRNIGYENAFDLVIISLPDPTNIFLNRYYTIEFFQELKAILSPHSIIAITLGFDKPSIDYNSSLLNESILNSVKRVFPNTILIPRGVPLVLASYDRNFTRAPNALSEFLKAIDGDTTYVTPATIKFRMNAADNWDIQRGAIRLNEDARPATLKYSFNELLFSMGLISTGIIDFTEKISPTKINLIFLLVIIITSFIIKKRTLSTKLQTTGALTIFSFTLFIYCMFVATETYNAQIFRYFSLILLMIFLGFSTALRLFPKSVDSGAHLRAKAISLLGAVFLIMTPSVFEISISPPGIGVLLFLTFSASILAGGIISQLQLALNYENNGKTDYLRSGKYVFAALAASALASFLIVPVTGIIDIMPALGIIALAAVFLLNI